MSLKHLILYTLIFCGCYTYSQEYILKGAVIDSLTQPLESANIIAAPKDKTKDISFAITDHKGRYKLTLKTGVLYIVTVSYLGYTDQILVIDGSTPPIQSHDFVMKANDIALKEVTIEYDYKPIIFKKDTTVYKVSAFASGKERKMKEILNKIPGIEVDRKGKITVQGKRVTKVLVEDKLFFGGNSKLAVENIPADALDKIEILEDYNKVSFLKGLNDSKELALNVKLKEEKKKFVFGDVDIGAGEDEYYQAHTGLFYYSPKTSISYIGDLNNIGKATFTRSDFIDFAGGRSSFLKNRSPLKAVSGILGDNQDVTETQNFLSALNFSLEASEKVDINGYGIFSRHDFEKQNESRIQFLLDDEIVEENRTNESDNLNILGVGNIKVDYEPTKKSRWFYNVNFDISNNERDNNLITNVENTETFFDTRNDFDNVGIQQFLEWHKSFNDKHTTTLVINHSYQDSNPFNQYLTNQVFLSGLIPLIPQNNIAINQIREQTTNSLDVLYKHYWVLNNYNHLYSNVGFNYSDQLLITDEIQLLDNGNENNFNASNFGNDTDYRFSDAYYGLEYKFKIGKDFTGKSGLYIHRYSLENRQLEELTTDITKYLLEPQFNADYSPNNSERFSLRYRLVNDFPDANNLANRFTLRSFNSVFRGNGLLQNERFHNANFRYSKISLYRNLFIYVLASFNRKVRSIRNEIQLQGINQFTSPVFTNNPETNWNVSGNFRKKIYRFDLGLKSIYSNSRYLQSVNDVLEPNRRTNIILGASIATKHKKWPYVRVGYEKGFSDFQGANNTNSEFQTDKLDTKIEVTVFKDWTLEADFESFRNYNVNNSTSNTFNIGNASLRYQKENSAWTFEFSVTNIFDTTIKTNNSFTDFTVNEQAVFILPRIGLAKVNYKL